MPLRKREKIQKMPRRSRCLIRLFSLGLLAAALYAQSDEALWKEFGLVQKSEATLGQASLELYRMKDPTGALAAWQWQRQPDAKTCQLEPFCTTDGKTQTVAYDNYLLKVSGPIDKGVLDAYAEKLPERRATALPALLTFVPRTGLIPNSARYIMGPASLKAFAEPLGALKPGFEQGTEAEVGHYKSAGAEPLNLAIFYFTTPEMARQHMAEFKAIPTVRVKRSTFLLAVVYGQASEQDANALLGQIEYQGHIRWNETSPPSPIKPLFLLIRNIIFLSIVLSALCFVAGLIYAGIRIYRRRFGTLDEDEAMTTLHLSGD